MAVKTGQVQKMLRKFPDHVPILCWRMAQEPHDHSSKKLLMPKTMSPYEFETSIQKHCDWSGERSEVRIMFYGEVVDSIDMDCLTVQEMYEAYAQADHCLHVQVSAQPLEQRPLLERTPSPSARPMGRLVERTPSPSARATGPLVKRSPSPSAQPMGRLVERTPSPSARPTGPPVKRSPSPSAQPMGRLVERTPSPSARPTGPLVKRSPSPSAQPMGRLVERTPSPSAQARGNAEANAEFKNLATENLKRGAEEMANAARKRPRIHEPSRALALATDVARMAAFASTGYIFAGGGPGAMIGFATACAKCLKSSVQ
ncbi:unnamed protein product [Symbiodinium natans]|uniref:Uncharacterized protein n=1 Tax=Symbiodinium natans TaxID=878477 RepID=A0A812JNV5_9DINO|nr:unnamed protein product [Symbiodinium natans]